MPTFADARAAVGAHWREKTAWSVAVTTLFCVPYFVLQQLGAAHARTLPSTAIDDAIAFDPAWAWVYQSGYLLMAAVPWLIDRRDDLHRYVVDFLCVSAIGFAIFLVLPIAGPRPAIVPAGGMYGLLVSYDGPTNAFPSLHVALLTLTTLVAARASAGRMDAAPRATVIGVASAWAMLVAFSALATRQHYAVDLPAGAALAWLVHRLHVLRLLSRRAPRRRVSDSRRSPTCTALE